MMLNIQSKEQLLEVLEKLRQNRMCCYINSQNFCDCKYSNIDRLRFPTSHGEGTGCPEMREAMMFIETKLFEDTRRGILTKLLKLRK